MRVCDTADLRDAACRQAHQGLAVHHAAVKYEFKAREKGGQH